MIRVTSPVYPEQPYKWGAASEGQCTWYAYYRAIEEGCTPPCWWDRETHTGSYTNAKLWLENYRDPWEVKGPEYIPVHGDIAVFTGTYGHVVYIEISNNGICTISEYNREEKETFDTYEWVPGVRLPGCGDLIGYLHYPYEALSPVDRDTSVDQIETTDTDLRIRTEPNLNGEIVGHVQLGYYNVYSITENDGYLWYEIAPNRYCANDTTIFLPKEDDEVERLRKENEELKRRLSEINRLSEVEYGIDRMD